MTVEELFRRALTLGLEKCTILVNGEEISPEQCRINDDKTEINIIQKELK